MREDEEKLEESMRQLAIEQWELLSDHPDRIVEFAKIMYCRGFDDWSIVVTVK